MGIEYAVWSGIWLTFGYHHNDNVYNNLYIQVVTLYRISKADKNHIVPPPPQTDFFWSFHHGLASLLFILNTLYLL